ncbi:MAG: GAF domain-containing protein [Bacteroidales bacterium]|nr:GAF domain-containing protein [Bacteroidales bacterium]
MKDHDHIITANVKLRKNNSNILIPITSKNKPEISNKILHKWQNLVNLLAKIINVPVALIMKINEEDIEVFLKNSDENNPYEQKEKAKLGEGLYCETVISTREKLLVPNALNNLIWEKNPDVKFNMISYLGFPIVWPDGEVFGTLCVLDSKGNNFNELQVKLLEQLKDILQDDLSFAITEQLLQKKLTDREIRLKEISHRTKNNYHILSSLLQIQALRLNSDEAFEIVNSIASRIMSFSMLHDKLDQSKIEQKEEVILEDYLYDLGTNILIQYVSNDYKFDISKNIIIVNFDKALTIGMIINELITNSIKYAYPNEEQVNIQILINKEKDNIINLKYQDNGIGLPENYKKLAKNSLGLKIIESCVTQLSGKLKVQTGPGSYFEFKFPE